MGYEVSVTEQPTTVTTTETVYDVLINSTNTTVQATQSVTNVNITSSTTEVSISSLYVNNLPVGGTTGQALVKINGTDYNTQWSTVSGADEKVKYDVNDAYSGYLGAKTVAGTSIVLAEGTGADADKLKISTSIDLTTLAKLAVSTTLANLIAMKNAGTLVPNQWYLVTDYQTFAFISGTNTTTYTAPVEQILVRAASTTGIDPNGYSYTYPTETIKFTTVVSPLQRQVGVINNSGYDETATTITDWDSDWFDVSETGNILPDFFTIDAYDPYNDVYIFFDYSGLDSDFTFTGGQFVLLTNPDGFDFTNCLTQDAGGYLYMDWAIWYGTPLGRITARYNNITDFYADTDYRGVKVRHWKVSAPAYTSGAKTAGYQATYAGYVWVCIQNTSSAPVVGQYWTILGTQGVNEYPLMNDIVGIGSPYPVYKDTNYQDTLPFQAGAYTGISKSGSRFTGDWTTFDIYMEQVPTNSTFNWGANVSGTFIKTMSNAKIDASGYNWLGAVSTIHYASISNCIINQFATVSYANIMDSILYQFRFSSANLLSSSLIASYGTYNTIGVVSYMKAYQSLTNNKLDNLSTVNFWGNFDYSNIQKATSVSFTDQVTGVTQFNAGQLAGVTFAYPITGYMFTGSEVHGYVAKTGTYLASALDYVIDCTANSFTVTLPTAVGISGRIYIIKNSGTGTITVDGNASETIDGAATVALTQYQKATIQSNGANWIVI